LAAARPSVTIDSNPLNAKDPSGANTPLQSPLPSAPKTVLIPPKIHLVRVLITS